MPIIGAGATEPDFAVPAPLALLPPARLEAHRDRPGPPRGPRRAHRRLGRAGRTGDPDRQLRGGEPVRLAPDRALAADGDRRRAIRRPVPDAAPARWRWASWARAAASSPPSSPGTATRWWSTRPPAGKGLWRRRVIDDSLVDAHALATGDLDGDGRDEIVAGFRGKGRRLLLYRARDDAAPPGSAPCSTTATWRPRACTSPT